MDTDASRSFPWHYGISGVRFHMVKHTGSGAVATIFKEVF